MIGGMAGALRWGLPKNHPGSQTPWLPTLIVGLDTLTGYLDERFLSEELEVAPELVPFETFQAASNATRSPRTPGSSAFCRWKPLCATSPVWKTPRPEGRVRTLQGVGPLCPAQPSLLRSVGQGPRLRSRRPRTRTGQEAFLEASGVWDIRGLEWTHDRA